MADRNRALRREITRLREEVGQLRKVIQLEVRKNRVILIRICKTLAPLNIGHRIRR